MSSKTKMADTDPSKKSTLGIEFQNEKGVFKTMISYTYW